MGGGLLDIFEALAEELRIAAIQADVVLRGRARFKANCAAHDKRDGLSLGLANTLRRARGGNGRSTASDRRRQTAPRDGAGIDRQSTGSAALPKDASGPSPARRKIISAWTGSVSWNSSKKSHRYFP